MPTIVAVAPDSPAADAGLMVGDQLMAVSGESIRDVIHYRMLVDSDEVDLQILRGALELEFDIKKPLGSPLGLEISAAVFDQVRTCDNHCEFCFIYQLPPGMRKSLYLKDDDYRLSFLYGNFTTLTRFTEADLERVVTEGLSPLYVSIHATDPLVRSDMLRNRRGATSLRWLRALLDRGVEIHGQIVLCPGLNDGPVLDDTLAGIADEYPELADVAVVPLGLSKFNTEARMRVHTPAEAAAVIDQIGRWQERFMALLGHPMVHASDELYIVGGRSFPPSTTYGDFSMHEDGIGMARAFEQELLGETDEEHRVQAGYFSWVDGAPAEGYRAPRWTPIDDEGRPDAASKTPSMPESDAVRVTLRPPRAAPIAVLTGTYGATLLRPLLTELVPEALASGSIRVVEVVNRYFGGNVAVAGLMVGEDLVAELSAQPAGHRYLLPDVCLSGNRFLDGMTTDDLPHPVEVVETTGRALRAALNGHIDQRRNIGR